MTNEALLLENLDKLHTTTLGEDRIRRNLKINVSDVVEYCKTIISDSRIYKEGKNWYCEKDDIRITVNSFSYTIITAHIIKNKTA